jgi:hypothetical protein
MNDVQMGQISCRMAEAGGLYLIGSACVADTSTSARLLRNDIDGRIYLRRNPAMRLPFLVAVEVHTLEFSHRAPRGVYCRSLTDKSVDKGTTRSMLDQVQEHL